MNSKITRGQKIASVMVSLTTSVMMVGGGFLYAPAVAQGVTASEIQAQITALQAQLNALLGGSSVPSGYSWSRSLDRGDTGQDVSDLQMALKADASLYPEGLVTGFFGPLTEAAVQRFQARQGIVSSGSPSTTGYGRVGPLTLSRLNSVYGSVASPAPAPVPGPAPVPVPAGAGLSVAAGSHPAATLAPQNAAGLPYTRVRFTAGASDVTVNSVTVERQGLMNNAALAGIVLLDENGVRMGVPRTLGSDNRVIIRDAFVVKAGQTRELSIAGDMVADLSSYSGQVGTLALVAIDAGSAVVSGSLPISGASHTVNSSLAIGTATAARGAFDPGSGLTKEVGTTAFTFSSIKITAGSAEKLWLKSIRWNQTGSAASGDLANLKTVVDGVEYAVTASSDGKFYASVFAGNGVEIDKGFSKDISIRGDIVGGSARTIDFDIDRRSDIVLQGNTFGYNILASLDGSAATADGSDVHNADNYYYDASQHTISAGTVTVSASTLVPAQNIAENVADQPLGGYTVDVKGEAVSVGSTRFNFLLAGAAAFGLADLTNLVLVDGNGTVVAGPVDGSGATTKSGTVTFSDTITYPIGITSITLKGKVGTDVANTDTIQVSTTPQSDWTSATGQVTGNSITVAPNAAVTSNEMTVRVGSLSATVSTQPAARTVISGSSQFEFARYILDATGSGEDVRMTTMLAAYGFGGGASATDLTNCKLYDGQLLTSPIVNSSNVLNPSAAGSSTSFTFDGSGLLLAKGSAKTLSLRCDVSASVAADEFFLWGQADNSSTYTGASGITSGQTVAETMTLSNGQTMTAATGGSYTVTNDTSVLYGVAQAGASDVTLGVLQFTSGNNEDVVLKQVALQLGNTASNSPADLAGQSVSLWNGATPVGVAQFGLGGNADNATSTLTSPVTIAAGETVDITIKAGLAPQNANEGTPGAFVTVNYDGDNNGLNGNYATGVGSGSTINGGTTSDVATNGKRVFRTYPSFADITSTSALSAGTGLYAIRVTAGSGRDVGLYKLTFKVATTGATVTGFQLFGPAGAVNATAVDAVDTDEAGNNVDSVNIVFDNNASDRRVPAGTSKDYRLQANTVSGLTADIESLNVALRGDAAYPLFSENQDLGSAADVDAVATSSDNVIWTPFSTTTPIVSNSADANRDWTNGYGLPGFPSVGQDFSVRVFSH